MRVLIADDNELIRRGFNQIVIKTFPNAKVAESGSLSETQALIRNEAWDLILLDFLFPDGSGLNAFEDLRRQKLTVRTLVISNHPDADYATRSLKAGATGYSSKDAPVEELSTALREVSEGRRYVSPSVAGSLAFDTRPSGSPAHELLTDRQRALLILMARGKGTAEIAAELQISPKTVSSHKKNIKEKLQARTNGELIRYAIEAGLTE